MSMSDEVWKAELIDAGGFEHPLLGIRRRPSWVCGIASSNPVMATVIPVASM